MAQRYNFNQRTVASRLATIDCNRYAIISPRYKVELVRLQATTFPL